MNQSRAVVDYFLDVAARCGDAKAAANWVTQDVLRVLKDQTIAIEHLPINSAGLADLIRKIKAGEIPGPRAKEVFQAMVDQRVDAAVAMSAIGIAAVDESELIALCEKLLAANPKTVADVQSGKAQAIGRAHRPGEEELNPNIDPGRFREMCLQLIQQGKA